MNALRFVPPFFTACLFLFLLACNLEKIEPGDGNNPTGYASKFQTTVGGNKNDFPNDVLVVANYGGYVVAGNSQSFTASGDKQAYLVKLDTAGMQVWEANFGADGKDDDAEAVAASADGGFVLAGNTLSFGANREVYLVKVNAQGNKVWEKSYGSTDSTEQAFGIVPIGVSDFLVGYKSSYNNGVSGSHIKLLRINSNGSRLWAKVLRTGNYDPDRMIKTSDGNVVIVGSEYASGTTSYIVKADANGNFIWENRYPAGGSSNYTPAYAVTELPNKDLVLAGSDLGSNDHDFNLAAFSSIGVSNWDKTWGGANADELFGVATTRDSQLVVMGYTGSFSASSEIYLSKRRASDGGQIWEKHFIPIGNLWGDVETCLDGGFIMVAGQNAVDADIIVVKTDANGAYE